MTQPTEQIGLDPLAREYVLRMCIFVIHAEALRGGAPLTMQVAGFRHAG